MQNVVDINKDTPRFNSLMVNHFAAQT